MFVSDEEGWGVESMDNLFSLHEVSAKMLGSQARILISL